VRDHGKDCERSATTELERTVLQTCGGGDGDEHVSVQLEYEGLHTRGGDEHV